MIKRANGSKSYSSNIPIAMIKDLYWNKGDKLMIEIIESKIVISRSEVENERN